MKLWGGRTSKSEDPAVHRLNASLSFDRRLYREDLEGSSAWAGALAAAGLLGQDELEDIQRGLEAVRLEMESGDFEFHQEDEDIHTAVERRLTELIGAAAGKLHTGRSRNDQVATDFRLWVMRASEALQSLVEGLARALGDQAQSGLMAPMPGYTHLQPAQVVTWGHWCLAHAWPLLRDRDRLSRVRQSADSLPLGSGALAGTSVAIDRTELARTLGFGEPVRNSLDGVSDRDFALEFLFAAAVIGVHLSRLAEQLIVFSSREFGFVRLDDAFTTGSSLMPQKRNPDPLELARGKSGRLIGDLTGLLASLKALPSAYDKDLQEDKEPVFDAYDSLASLLPPLTGLVESLEINRDRMLERLDADLMATDMADYLVDKGVPFREAHHHVGELFRMAEERGQSVDRLSASDLSSVHPALEPDVLDRLDPVRSLAQRGAIGGTSRSALEAQLNAFRDCLGSGSAEPAELDK